MFFTTIPPNIRLAVKLIWYACCPLVWVPDPENIPVNGLNTFFIIDPEIESVDKNKTIVKLDKTPKLVNVPARKVDWFLINEPELVKLPSIDWIIDFIKLPSDKNKPEIVLFTEFSNVEDEVNVAVNEIDAINEFIKDPAEDNVPEKLLETLFNNELDDEMLDVSVLYICFINVALDVKVPSNDNRLIFIEEVSPELVNVPVIVLITEFNIAPELFNVPDNNLNKSFIEIKPEETKVPANNLLEV